MNRRRAAFTLIELLVVIGIIAVLIAILVPVVSKVRLAAKTAEVTAQVHRISAAIGNYYNDFKVYPGLLANSDFAPPGPGSRFKDPSFATYTQSEDLVMALRGGLNPGFPYGKGLELRLLELDQGPMNFTPAVLPRKHTYVSKIAAEFPPEDQPPGAPVLQSITNWATTASVYPGLSYVKDSSAPEFMDTYSEPRPILYLRQNGGATSSTSSIVYNSKVSGTFNPAIAYDLATIQPYLQSSLPRDDFHDPKDAQHSASSTGFSGGNLDPTKQWVIDYFASPSGNTAKGGGYLLIDAGPDRIFGTNDDIVVGAGGGQ